MVQHVRDEKMRLREVLQLMPFKNKQQFIH